MRHRRMNSPTELDESSRDFPAAPANARPPSVVLRKRPAPPSTTGVRAKLRNQQSLEEALKAGFRQGPPWHSGEYRHRFTCLGLSDERTASTFH